ncbi:PREDICTED: RNA-binding protein 48 [Lupinus angustifolius]|uniref:RNA-binding protein 48 n=1 Tax=Lupinus angustifolius TaxID=3871 RepID=UPI00092EF5B1|nr:PREDICTED: RNA-binding protein 48 [Lupinus angustifolius]XP_019449273.1 PREDICTED: RNA-binding protein 48 [Lupinus angustifolius]
MPRCKDEPTAVRVYTVCHESRYLTVRNVPALGCGDDLLQLFSAHGEVEECKPMDAEDCEPFTDVYWIKFRLFSNARFAKRKLDDSVFLGNRLQVSYAPQFESHSDTKDKLEGRRREVLARLNPRRSKETTTSSSRPPIKSEAVAISSQTSCLSGNLGPNERDKEFECRPNTGNLPMRMVSSNEDYFASHSMNQTVRIVRDKLDKIRSSGEHLEAGSASKKTRVDNRRRI